MLHGPDAPIADLPQRVTRLIAERLGNTELGRTTPPDVLMPMFDGAITPEGLGVAPAWDLFESAVAAHTVALDGPRYLAFIPMSPAAAAIWMDAVVGATSFSAESWLEAAGAVAAENQALDWIRRLAGMPEGAGGAFCSGGSIGNLSAMAVARDVALARDPRRRLCAVADTAHASVENSLRLLGMDELVVPTGPDGRFTGGALATALAESGAPDELALVVASSGSTNAGVVDDLRGLADGRSRARRLAARRRRVRRRGAGARRAAAPVRRARRRRLVHRRPAQVVVLHGGHVRGAVPRAATRGAHAHPARAVHRRAPHRRPRRGTRPTTCSS